MHVVLTFCIWKKKKSYTVEMQRLKQLNFIFTTNNYQTNMML